MDIKQAKDFLVEEVSEQAALEGVAFSDLEKKMMYFIETDTESGDAAAFQNEFHARHDVTMYEGKVSTLLHRRYERLKNAEREKVRVWDQAIRVLEDGDHYLLVLWAILPPEERPARASAGWSGGGLFVTLLVAVAAVIWLLFSNAR